MQVKWLNKKETKGAKKMKDKQIKVQYSSTNKAHFIEVLNDIVRSHMNE